MAKNLEQMTKFELIGELAKRAESREFEVVKSQGFYGREELIRLIKFWDIK